MAAGARTQKTTARRRVATRVRVASLVLACTLALAAAGGALDGAASGATSLPRCAASQLRLVLVRQSAAVSRRFWEMALRNAGRGSCSLRGYPGVGLLGSSGRLLGVAVKREPGQAVRTVTIAPGRRAYFTFAYEDSGPCLPRFFSAYGISVYPPGSTVRLVRRTARFDICAIAVGGSPAVTPVRATLEP